MHPLILASLLIPSIALGEAHLLVSAEGDVRILVDGEDVGQLAGQGHAPVLVQQAGRHGLRVESHSGKLLAEQNIELDEDETMVVHWDGERLKVQPVRAMQLEAAEAADQDEPRRPSAMQTAQAGATVASMLAPANPVVSGVAVGLSAASAGSTLVHSAGGAIDYASRGPSAPPATSAREDHSLDHLTQSDFDPYEASGGRPTIDASLASVTFVAAAGTDALITIDSQPVGTISEGTREVTVPVVPGMHKVMIFDPDGAELLHTGRLVVTAGWVLEIHFSTTEPPTSTLPEAWR